MAAKGWTKIKPKELEQLIKDYFDSITVTEPVLNAKGEHLKNNKGEYAYKLTYIEHPSMTALCKYCGTTKMQLCHRWKDKEEFKDIIAEAKERVEMYLEDQLFRKEQVVGIIFNLKNNFGWKDKQDVDVNANVNTIKVKLPDDIEE